MSISVSLRGLKISVATILDPTRDRLDGSNAWRISEKTGKRSGFEAPWMGSRFVSLLFYVREAPEFNPAPFLMMCAEYQL